MARPVGYRPGYPPETRFTQTAGSGFQATRAGSGAPFAAASSNGTMSSSSRVMMTWHSGSPQRQLYSRTFGPSAVSMRPTKSTPRYGVPSRASAGIVGLTMGAITPRPSAAANPGTGEYAPIPPVLGPRSAANTGLGSLAPAS